MIIQQIWASLKIPSWLVCLLWRTQGMERRENKNSPTSNRIYWQGTQSNLGKVSYKGDSLAMCLREWALSNIGNNCPQRKGTLSRNLFLLLSTDGRFSQRDSSLRPPVLQSFAQPLEPPSLPTNQDHVFLAQIGSVVRLPTRRLR